MSQNPLIIGEAQRAAFCELRDRAAADPLDVREVLELIKTPEGKRRHMERMANFTIDVPMAYAVTFTIEIGHPAGPCRHMSMSSHRRGKTPTPEAVWMIAEEFGFIGGLRQCSVWPEDIGAGDKAVNVVQPLAVQEPP